MENKVNENTPANALESDEEYETIMNNKVENILNVKNSSRDNSIYKYDNETKQILTEAKQEIKKKISFKPEMPEEHADKEKDNMSDKVNWQKNNFNMIGAELNENKNHERDFSEKRNKIETKINYESINTKDFKKDTGDNHKNYNGNFSYTDNSSTKLDMQTGNSFSNFVVNNAKPHSKPKLNFQKNHMNGIIQPFSSLSEKNIIANKTFTNLKEKTDDYSSYTKTLTGQRLYLQHVQNLPKKKEQRQKMIEEKEKDEFKEVSFKPKILESSQRIASKSPDRIKMQKIEELLLHKGNVLKEKKIYESTKKVLKEFDEYSFLPKVGEKSGMIASVKRKQRLEKLSEINSRHLLNKSCDIPHRELSESIPSDEEKIRNYYVRNEIKNSQRIEQKFITNNNKNLNLKIGINNRNETIGRNDNNYLKNSIASSDNTFTNMKLVPKVKKGLYNEANNAGNVYSKSNKNDNSLERERNRTFNTSQNDLSITTPYSHHSGSRSYTNSPKRNIEKKATIFYNRSKSRNNFGPIQNKKIQNTISNNYEQKQTLRSKTPTSVGNLRSNVNMLNPHKNIHDFLYVENEIIKQKKEENELKHMKKNFPFRPTITDNSKNLISRSETTSQFIHRLMNSKKEAEELIVVKRKKNNLNNEIDPRTGKQFYKPSISRGPLNPEKDRRVHDNLDGFHDYKILSEKNKIQEQEMLNILEKKNLWMERSMKSILKMKIERYKEIFDSLDSDKDGFISSRQIRSSALDSEMLTTMTPLLEDLQKKGNKMNFKEFCLAVDKFLPVRIFTNQR